MTFMIGKHKKRFEFFLAVSFQRRH